MQDNQLSTNVSFVKWLCAFLLLPVDPFQPFPRTFGICKLHFQARETVNNLSVNISRHRVCVWPCRSRVNLRNGQNSTNFPN